MNHRKSLELLRFALVILGIAGGCGVNRPPMVPEITPREQEPLIIFDTEETFWPDPVERTHVRLGSLQHLVERYRSATGQLPLTLEEFLPRSSDRDVLSRDGWAQVIRFRPLPGDYEFASPGPDGLLGTSDDIVATSNYEMPVFRRPEGQFTSVLLRGFQIQLTLYFSRTGALPLRLGDLASIGLLPSLGSADRWGEPVVYSVRGDEFEVRSAGPDRRLNTHDDMVVQGFDPVLRTMDSGPSPW